jgi:hypothetical protein
VLVYVEHHGVVFGGDIDRFGVGDGPDTSPQVDSIEVAEVVSMDEWCQFSDLDPEVWAELHGDDLDGKFLQAYEDEPDADIY